MSERKIEYRCVECDSTQFGDPLSNPICEVCGEVMEATE